MTRLKLSLAALVAGGVAGVLGGWVLKQAAGDAGPGGCRSV